MIPGVKYKKFSTTTIELNSKSLNELTEVTETDIKRRPISALTDDSTTVEDKEIKYFIKVNDDYQALRSVYKQDALVLGVRQGNEAQVRQLLMLQKERQDSIDTALWFACKNNDVSIAELLLDNGAFPGYNTVCKTSCIHLSALHGATSLIFSFLKRYPELSTIRMQKSILLEVTPDRPLVEFPEGALPVHMCAFGGLSSLPLFDALLKLSDVDIRDANERSPLMYACKGGNCFSVRALLLKGADIEHTCKEGRTSLLYAATNGDYSVLELLIKRNACLDVRDIEKKGIFSYAKDEEVANAILSCTVNFFEESAVELLPIRELITKGYHQAQKKLLDSMVTTPQEDTICIDLEQLELEPPDCERKEKLLNIITEQSPDLPLFDSIVLRSYAKHHMNRYGYFYLTIQMVELIIYLAALSLALMLEVDYNDANRLTTHYERFHLACAVYVLLRLVLLAGVKIVQFGVIFKHKFTENIHLSESRFRPTKYRIERATYLALREYLTDASNAIDVLVLVTALVYIILRVSSVFVYVGSSTSLFAVLLYFFSICITFRYLIVIYGLGNYLQTLLFALKDSIWFTMVFMISLVAFSGMFFISIHAYDYITPKLNATDDKYDNLRERFDEEYIWILLTGIRLLLEQGAVIKFNYLEVYNWLMVIVFMLFAFVTLLVLRTLYIAKITSEYKRIHELAKRYSTHRRLKFIINLHSKSIYSLNFLKKYLQKYRKKIVLKKDKVRSQHPEEFQSLFSKREQENVHSKLEELRREVLERIQTQENKLDEVIRLIQQANRK